MVRGCRGKSVLHGVHGCGLCLLCHEEAEGPDEAEQAHDEQLPGQQQVATAEESQCRRDGLGASRTRVGHAVTVVKTDGMLSDSHSKPVCH